MTQPKFPANDSESSPATSPTLRPPRRNELPTELLQIIGPAFQVGGIAGFSGLVVGGFAGVIRSSTPTLFALASGIQWFTLGTTFWASRGAVIHTWGKDNITPKERISASAIAGGIAGTCGGLLRGRKNILPGLLVFSLFGGIGQKLYNLADARNSELIESGEKGKSLHESWINSKWSPMKVLSDKEYEDMLREKLLKVDVEIALVDDSIARLRKKELEEEDKEAASK